MTPGGEQRFFEYPLTPQPMATAGQLHRDSLLQRSAFWHPPLDNRIIERIFSPLGGNGLDFFQADPLTAQYLQPTSPSPGLPIAVR